MYFYSSGTFAMVKWHSYGVFCLFICCLFCFYVVLLLLGGFLFVCFFWLCFFVLTKISPCPGMFNSKFHGIVGFERCSLKHLAFVNCHKVSWPWSVGLWPLVLLVLSIWLHVLLLCVFLLFSVPLVWTRFLFDCFFGLKLLFFYSGYCVLPHARSELFRGVVGG